MAVAFLSRCPFHLYPACHAYLADYPRASPGKRGRARTSCNAASIWTSRVTCLQLSNVKIALRDAAPGPAFSFKSPALFSAPLLANLLLPCAATAFGIDGLSLTHHIMQFSLLADLDPSVASLLIRVLGPVFASLNFLFIIRIVMSWYPQLPVDKFPYVVAFAPTEPVLEPTRKLIPPVGGVDVSPVIWVALMSFLSEILLGQQGLLVLLSQQQG